MRSGNKRVGDKVEAGDLLFEVATDKATVEYNALDEGWLRKILVNENGEVSVNDPVAIFTEKKDESIDGYKPKRITSADEKPAASDTQEGTEPAAAARSAKKSTETPKGSVLAQPTFAPEPPLENYSFNAPSGDYEKRTLASPLARKVAKEKGLDITTVKGTGPGDRIMEKDLERAQAAGIVNFGKREAPTIAPGTL